MTNARRRRTVDPRLAAMPDAYLECRDERHDFPASATTTERVRFPEVDTLERRSTCARCGTVRTRWVDIWEGTLARPTQYVHPDGYSVEPGSGRVPLAVVRLERVRRWLDLTEDPGPRTRRRSRGTGPRTD